MATREKQLASARLKAVGREYLKDPILREAVRPTHIERR
jgi:hypothetical protein